MQGSARHVDIARRQRIIDFVDADSAGRHPVRIQINPHGIALRAKNLRLCNPFHSGNRRQHRCFHIFLNLGNRHRLGSDDIGHNRLLGRVGFRVGRRIGQILRQSPLGRRNGAADILGNSIHAAVQGKSNRDGCGARRI